MTLSGLGLVSSSQNASTVWAVHPTPNLHGQQAEIEFTAVQSNDFTRPPTSRFGILPMAAVSRRGIGESQ